MKAKLVDLTFTMEGKQRLTLEFEKGYRNDFRQKFDSLKDREVRVKVSRWREKRSVDANAYMWVLVDKIAEAMTISKEEVYRKSIKNIGGVSQIVCVLDDAVDKLRDGWREHGIGWQTDTMPSKIPGCTNVVLYYGSSTYDSKQMFALIDNLIQDAKALGIETATPEELAKMKGLFEDESSVKGSTEAH